MDLNDLTFRVADEVFRITSSTIADLRLLLPSYAPFYLKEKDIPGICSLNVEEVENLPLANGEELGQFDCGGINHGVYRLEEGGYTIVISNVNEKPVCSMLTTADFSHCEVSVVGSEDDQRFGLNNAAMIAFAFSAAYHRVLLFHSSVTMNSGKGFMFLGKSGTGKSTHSSLWMKNIPGSDLLNDDNPAVKISADGNVATVYGTPWSGKTPCYRNLSVPVGAIVRLEQYPENIINKESPLQAYASLLSSCSTMIWDKPSYDLILNTLNSLVKIIPVFHLRCLPDREAAELCHCNVLPNG